LFGNCFGYFSKNWVIFSKLSGHPGGKRADALMNLLFKEFDNRHEVEGMVQISVFKHKKAQSGAALISYKKDSFTDVIMNIYHHHFCIQLQPKVISNVASD
jgi:hypothetical protein